MLKNISRIRCAIYTRKSNNRLLDQDVNSLVTQRETCSAYIKSQQYKNWSELPEQYDDGGHSGSGLDRPALAQLMQDIDAGLIDMIVVYKIDRLTRSLADFVRLIEILDRQHVALVSISQAFDTSDSMGRMILNILLTFSQFERELVAERVRDNVRVRKRHGLSHGGTVPFGYTNCEEGIEIDEAEAKIVRYIYRHYLKLERYTPVMTAVREAGLRSSRKRLKNGSYKGGKVITSGHVYSILGNPIYVGEIRGPEENYPGRHEPILDRETWDAVQLVRKERKKKIPHPKLADHFLSGILWDDLGRQMLSRVRTREATIYSTYVSSNTAWSQREYRRQYHCKADELEKVVVASVSDFLSDRRKLRKALVSFGIFGPELEELTAKGQAAAPLLEDANTQHKGDILTAILNRIEVGTENLLLTFRGLELRRFLEWNGWAPFKGRPADWPCSDARHTIDLPICMINAFRGKSLHIKPANPNLLPQINAPLVRLIESARKAQKLMEENRNLNLEELAKQFGCRRASFTKLIKMNYLAPDILTSIFDGTQPEQFDRAMLLGVNIPNDWAIQRKLFGFDEHRREIKPRLMFGRGMWPSN